MLINPNKPELATSASCAFISAVVPSQILRGTLKCVCACILACMHKFSVGKYTLFFHGSPISTMESGIHMAWLPVSVLLLFN